jgi:hypothetical protein
MALIFFCFRLFHGTLAQSQRKLPGPVRARVASSCHLLLLRALVQSMGRYPLPPGQDKEATISSLGILL